MTYREIGSDLITLAVGEAQKLHAVHRDLLVAASPYFKAMFSGAWKECGHPNEPVPLVLADDRIFPHFLNWLYFRRFNWTGNRVQDSSLCPSCGHPGCTKTAPVCPDNAMDEMSMDLDGDDDEALEAVVDFIDDEACLVHLYIFADRFDVPALREDIINKRWADYIKHPTLKRSYYVPINCFRHLPESSPMCRLVLDMFVNEWQADNDYNSACSMELRLRSKLPANFMFKLAARQARKASANDQGQAVGPLCDYHEHPQDKETVNRCRKKMAALVEQSRVAHADYDALESERLGDDSDAESEVSMLSGLTNF